MAIYTCYDMIRDCREGKAEGWRFLVVNYVPALRKIASQYGVDEWGVLEKLRSAESPLKGMTEMSGREFMDQLRSHVVPRAGESSVDVDGVLEALSPLTATERQQAWFGTFGYAADDASRMMRLAPETGRKIYERAGELLRGKLDDWQAGMLAKHGLALGEAVEKMRPAEPMPYREFFDVIDGRNTWQQRTGFAKTLESSWYEVHRACSIREADEALEKSKTLTETEALPYLERLGVKLEKRGLWARFFKGKG